MSQNHQVIHLNNRKRSKSPHFRNQENSLRGSTLINNNNCKSQKIVDTPSPIFGLNQLNDSHQISQGRLDSNRSPSVKGQANTKRFNKYNQNTLTNSGLFKSQISNSLIIDTLEGQQKRSLLGKQFGNNNSFVDCSKQLQKSQLNKNLRNSERIPQEMSRRVRTRQSAKSPQKLDLVKNMININELDLLRKSQNKSPVLINISNQQNSMANSFGANHIHNSMFDSKPNGFISNSPTATTIQNSKSNILIVPAQTTEPNQKSLIMSTSQEFLRNPGTQSFQNAHMKTSQGFFLNKNQQKVIKNSPGYSVNISPDNKYQPPQQLVRIMSPQRINHKINKNLNEGPNYPLNVVRKISSSPIFNKTLQSPQNASRILIDQNKKPYVVTSVSDRQKELIRKNKVLQNRIGQLHSQKQNVVLSLKEQNIKLINQNNQLKQKLIISEKQLQNCHIQLQKIRNSYGMTIPLHQKQFTADVVQQKVSQLDLNQSQYQFANINVGNQVIGIANLDKHSRQKLSLVQDYQQKIQILINNLQTEKQINQTLNQQISKLKLFSQTQTQKQNKSLIHHLGGKNQSSFSSSTCLQKEGNTKRQLQNLKKTIIQDSRNIQINNKMIIQQYQKQIATLKNKIQETQKYRVKRKSQIQNSLSVRNSGISYSNQQHTENNISRMTDCNRSPSANTYNYPEQNDKSGEDDYQQIQNLNKILDKITELQQKNSQLQTLATNLTIQRDNLLQTIETYQLKIKELQNNQEKLKQNLNETICKNTESIRKLILQKQQYTINLKNYAQQLNQLRNLCQKYSQKIVSFSSSGVQTQNGIKKVHNYDNNYCKKCQDLMKTVSKLNSHLNSRK